MAEAWLMTGELHVPAAYMAAQPMDVIERELCAAGMLPADVQSRRWRIDPEQPGGYILMYTAMVSRHAEEGK